MVHPTSTGDASQAVRVVASSVSPQGVWTLANQQPVVSDTAPIAYDSAADRLIYFGSGTSPLFGRSTLFGDAWTYNVTANLWANVSTSGAPRFRTGYQIAYDPPTDRVLMYGGNLVFPFSGGANLPPTNELWTFAPGTGTWTNATPTVSPSITCYFSMTFDSTRNHLILFGGLVGYEVWSNATWVYDVRAGQWTNVTPVASPSARDGAAMAYDPVTDKVLLFGGENGSGMLGDSWTLDPATNRWSRIPTPIAPPPTAFAPAVYDPSADRMLVFGPGGATWVFDGGTGSWSSLPLGAALTDAPYNGATATYDSAAHVTLVLQPGAFGGASMLSYTFAGNVWTYLSPGNWPGVTMNPSMTYDVAADRILLFGGTFEHPLQCSNLTWAYDLEHNRWDLRHPRVAPPCGVIVYDSAADRVVLFDGASSSTWAYNYTGDDWTQMHPATSPPVAFDVSYAMTYDARDDRVVLFGGFHRGGGFSRETWAYSLQADAWENRTLPSGPPPLESAAMAYDTLTGRIVLFGGVPFDGSGATNDTWIYDYGANDWSKVTPVVSPPPRSAAGLVYDDRADRFVLFGGSGPVSNRNDTWRYDASTNQWTEMVLTFHPSARAGFGIAYDSRSDRVVLLGGNAGGSSDGTWWYAYASGPQPPGGPGSGGWSDAVVVGAFVVLPVVAFGAVLYLWARSARKAARRGKE